MTDLSQCPCCGQLSKEFNDHHILPRSMGGLDEPSNIIRLCVECHSKIHHMGSTRIANLVKEGITKAKLAGKKLGPPFKMDMKKLEKAKSMLNQGIKMRQIELETGLSRTTIYRWLAKLNTA